MLLFCSPEHNTRPIAQVSWRYGPMLRPPKERMAPRADPGGGGKLGIPHVPLVVSL